MNSPENDELLADLIEEILENLSKPIGRVIVIDSNNKNTVLLSDYEYWANHDVELITWCNQYPEIKRNGMTLSISCKKVLTLFLMKWN